MICHSSDYEQTVYNEYKTNSGNGNQTALKDK